jgi:pimeloyl-ACP methyl ester carboxylesterase
VSTVRRLIPVLCAVAALALPASAAAQAGGGFSSDCGESNFECMRVNVPIDRAGAVEGTLPIYVERTPGGGRSPIFTMAGGPGQGATTLSENFTRDLGPALRDGRYLVVMDQRGTGRSRAINCKGLQTQFDKPIDARAAACADQLGSRSSLYTTRDSVDDIEAVRAKIGEEKISLYGVSYGTKVAVAYALEYPQHVDRLILDSVVEPEGQNPLDVDSFGALPRVLTEICRGECANVTDDLAGDLAELADRLRTAPLRGPFVTRRGKRKTVKLTARALYQTLRSGDTNAGLRAEYPGAVRSALEGDPAPLLRIEHRFDSVKTPTEVPPDALRALSFGLFTATLCEEAPLPWERTAAVGDERLRQARERAAALPDSAFEPFDRQVALAIDNNSALRQCSLWPAAAAAPVLTGLDQPFPDVPVLVVEGLEDIRTPLEVGTRLAARFPNATVLQVPKAAHGAVGDEPKCTGIALRRFFAGRAVGTPCAQVKRSTRVLPKLPNRLSDVKPHRGTSGAPGRTFAATIATLDDMYTEQYNFLGERPRGGGLRGGRYVPAPKRGARLKGLSLVPGVTLTGTLRDLTRPRGKLRVGGKSAARGTLTLSRSGVLRGRLGGKRVKARYKPPRIPGP